LLCSFIRRRLNLFRSNLYLKFNWDIHNKHPYPTMRWVLHYLHSTVFYPCFHFLIRHRLPHAQQEMLTLPEHLIPPLVFHRIQSCPVICVSFFHVQLSCLLGFGYHRSIELMTSHFSFLNTHQNALM